MGEVREVKEMLNKLSIIRNKANDCIKNLPDRKIYSTKSGNSNQYYWINEKNKKNYIKKKDIALAQQLVQKEYAQKILNMINKKEQSIKTFLDNCDKYSLIKVYENMPDGKKKLLEPYVISDEEYKFKWKNEKNKMIKKKDDCESVQQIGILTENGEYVRSKSEKIIADKLFASDIPYVYEFPHYLQGYGYVYSDFTILNVNTRQEYVWEHFGMMDNEEYVKSSMRKIKIYAKNGYVQGKNFITTFESHDVPLATNVINGIIENLLQ